jgi:hypothetical protein
MPTPPPKKEKVEEIVRRYLACGGPERSWSVAAKACGFVNGKQVQPYIQYWSDVYHIHVPARTYESMSNREKQMAEIKWGQGVKVQVPEEVEEPELKRTQPPAFTLGELPTYLSRPDNTYVFGACGDTHLGSKYERMDALDDYYDRNLACGSDRIFHTGNWIDGYLERINAHDVHTPHMEGQLRYLAQAYPRRDGLVTYAVAGDDHEGWWSRSHGIDIGKRAEQTMREHGRQDWVDLGYMEAHVRLVNANTGKETILAVAHPGGGSAYADSYSVQKIIESLDGGEKPAVGLYGHYHKLMFGEYRNVWWVQTGCFQDQTPFARGKKLRFAVGGAIVRLEQDPNTGAIVACTVQLIRYFVTGYYNHRWNKAGPVVLPNRSTVV